MAAKQGKQARSRMLVAGVVACVGVAGVAGFWTLRKAQMRANHAQLRAEGLAAAAAGKDAEAAAKLWQYLQVDQADVEVLEAFAKSRIRAPLPKGQHVQDSISALTRLSILAPERMDVKGQLCELQWRRRGLTEVLDLSGQILQKSPGDVKGLRYRTLALQALKRTSEAVRSAEEWVKAAPQDVDGQVLLYRLLIGDASQQAAGLERLEGYAAANAGDFTAQLVRATIYVDQARVRDAEKVLADLVRRAEVKNAEVVERLVGLLEAVGQKQASVDLLERSLAALESPRVRLLLARRRMESGDLVEAVKTGSTGSTSETQDELWLIRTISRVLGRRAGLNVDGGASGSGTGQVTGDPQGPVTDAEVKEIGGAPGGDAGWRVVAEVMMGRTPVEQQDIRKAMEQIKGVIALGDSGPYPWFALGVLQGQAGEVDLASDSLTRSAERSRSWTMPLLRASEMSIAAGKLDQAKRYAGLAVLRAREDVKGYLQLARSMYVDYKQRGNGGADLLRFVQDVQRSAPGEPTTLLMEADLLAGRGENAAARGRLETGLKGAEALPEEFLLNAAVLSTQNGLGVEREYLSVAEKRFGRTPRWRFVTGSLLAGIGKAKEGLEVVQEGLKEPGTTAAQKGTLKEFAARLAEQAGLPEAAELWTAAVEANPGNLRLLRAATEAPSTMKDPKQRESLIARLREVEGDTGTAWRIARAKELLRTGGTGEGPAREAAVLLADALSLGSTAAETHVLLARAMGQWGNVAGAITQLEAAVRIDPGAARTRLMLAAYLQQRKDFDGAKAQIDAALAAEPGEQVSQVAAQLLASLGDSAAAIGLIEKLPVRDRRSDLMLGELYERTGRVAEASAVADRLLKEPDVASILLAAKVADTAGQKEQEKAVLGRLEKVESDELTRKLALAQHYASTGQAVEARKLLDEVAKRWPSNEAAYRLRLFLELAAGNPVAAVETAKAAKAGGAKSALFDAAVQKQETIVGLYGRGIVRLAMDLAMEPASADRDQLAEAILKADGLSVGTAARVIRERASSAPGDFGMQQAAVITLAKLGRTTDAAALAGQLAQALPNSTDAALLWADTELLRGDPESILTAVQWLRQRSSVLLPLAEVNYSRALRQAGRVQEAYDVMSALLPRVEGAGSASGKTLTALAEAPAAQWMTEYGLCAYATGQRKRFDERFAAWAERAAELPRAWGEAVCGQMPAGIVAEWAGVLRGRPQHAVWLATGVSAAAKRTGDAALAALAGELYEKAKSEPGLAAVDRLNLAVLSEMRGDDASAEKTYREMLQDKVLGAGAKNNLAVVLARTGRTKEAVALAQEALAAAPNEPQVMDTLADALARDGRAGEAVSTMESAVRAAPSDVRLRLALVKYLVAAGRKGDARTQVLEIEAQLADRRGGPDVTPDLAPLKEQLSSAK